MWLAALCPVTGTGVSSPAEGSMKVIILSLTIFFGGDSRVAAVRSPAIKRIPYGEGRL
jgi:hypothetical protein